MKRAINGLLWLAALAGLALLAASTAGALHPAGDSLAVIRWQMAGALALVAALLGALGARRAVWLLLPASLALGQAGWAWFRPQPDPEAPLVLYQKNLSFRLADPAALIADIRAASPDAVTLQEVTPRNRAVLNALADDLPTQLWCPGRAVGGPALASRWAAIEGTAICGPEGGVAALQVAAPGGPLWLVSLHMPWPWPYDHPAYVRDLLAVLVPVTGPVLIGGDFNMVPWGARNDIIAGATDTRRVGRALNTFPRFGPLLPLPIDLVYAPRDARGRVDLRPALGSDHRGVLARIRL